MSGANPADQPAPQSKASGFHLDFEKVLILAAAALFISLAVATRISAAKVQQIMVQHYQQLLSGLVERRAERVARALELIADELYELGSSSPGEDAPRPGAEEAAASAPDRAEALRRFLIRWRGLIGFIDTQEGSARRRWRLEGDGGDLQLEPALQVGAESGPPAAPFRLALRPAVHPQDAVILIAGGGGTAAAITLDKFSRFEEFTGLPPGRFIYVLDPENRVLFAPRAGEVGRSAIGTGDQLAESLAQLPRQAPQAALLPQPRSADRRTQAGCIVASAPLRLGAETLRIFEGAEAGPILSPIKNHTRFLFVTMELVLLALAFLVMTLYRSQRQRAVLEAKAQSTAELQELNLRLEQAMRVKSQFLANMSHELRTPLNGISSAADLLGDTALSAEQRGFLGVVKSCAAAMIALINDILDLTRIEAGKVQLYPTPFELRGLLDEVCGMLALAAAEQRVELVVEVSSAIPRCLSADVFRLRQVMLNLVGNAVKFTRPGGAVLIQVRRHHSSADGITLFFAVTDSGVGIAPEDQQRIFESFSQADASITRRHGGSGLGLTISRQLVELMGGRLGVRSRLGVGSVFYFTLPCREAAAPERAQAEAPRAESAHFPAADGPGLRLLLVEDNPINQKLIARTLEKMGHSVLVANEGRQALELLERERVDLVLMDVQMPVMDGLSAAQAIRARERQGGAHLPIVALTAHALAGDRERCLAAGMDDCLVKPVDRRQLAQVLRRFQRSG